MERGGTQKSPREKREREETLMNEGERMDTRRERRERERDHRKTLVKQKKRSRTENSQN